MKIYLIIIINKNKSANHHGGQIQFGPKDGYLYLGIGDGGGGGDPDANGQNTNTLLGKILRINVDTSSSPSIPYSIPSDNPFVTSSTSKKEIFAYGMRNPWRMSFDEEGHLWVADVGQSLYEELDVLFPSQTTNNVNYGWNKFEACDCYATPCTPISGTSFTFPVHYYPHTVGSCITAGYEYTGSSIPDLLDHFIFGDFIQGQIWSIPVTNLRLNNNDCSSPISSTLLLATDISISTFGRINGEIYVGDYATGFIYLIAPSVAPSSSVSPSLRSSSSSSQSIRPSFSFTVSPSSTKIPLSSSPSRTPSRSSFDNYSDQTSSQSSDQTSQSSNTSADQSSNSSQDSSNTSNSSSLLSFSIVIFLCVFII